MKKLICMFLAVFTVFALAAFDSQPTVPAQEAQAPTEWTRSGYFQDEDGDFLSITWMDDVIEPGWYVGVMIGEVMTGWTIPQEGDTLHGDLNAWDDSAEETFIVTISEEGEDGLLLTVEDGESYHFTPLDLPDATIFVSINTEGWGSIAYAEGEEAPEIDPDRPYQSAQINLAEPADYTFAAQPQAGSLFVKWTKDGEDFSEEPQIAVFLDESAEFIAVFEEDPDWQNPAADFTGIYQSGRARAAVEAIGSEDAWITIDWGGSAAELAHWDIFGTFDTETQSISYDYCTKSIIVYDENGDVISQEPEYENGSGTVTFNGDGTFTWHEDQSVYSEDMVFELLQEAIEGPSAERSEDRAGDL